MEFREAAPVDAESVQRVARASWHSVHDHILGENAVEKLLDSWYDRDRLEESIGREDTTMFLGINNGEVVGFAQGEPSEDAPADAAVVAIYFLPEYWGKGFGTELLELLFDAFRRDDQNSVWLTVLANNEVGRSFYDKHNFEIHEERMIELAGQEVEEVVLIRDL